MATFTTGFRKTAADKISQLEKSAFIRDFLERREAKKRNEARLSYEASKHSWGTATAHHPVPKKYLKKWDEEFERAGVKGTTDGWNFFSDRVNPWLETAEGKQWNEQQSEKMHLNPHTQPPNGFKKA